MEKLKKFKFTWNEIRTVVIEAQDEQTAWFCMEAGDDGASEFVGTDNYVCEEVKHEEV